MNKREINPALIGRGENINGKRGLFEGTQAWESTSVDQENQQVTGGNLAFAKNEKKRFGRGKKKGGRKGKNKDRKMIIPYKREKPKWQ